MIAAAILMAGQVSGPTIVEYPAPQYGVVSIQCAVRYPELNLTEASIVGLLPGILSSGSARYPGVLFRNYAAKGGAPFRVTARPDGLRIEVQTMPLDLELGMDLMASLLREPEIDRAALRAALESAPIQPRDWFLSSLSPTRPEYEGTRVEQVLQLFRRVVRPEHVTIAVGGAFEPGVPTTGFGERMRDWRVPASRELLQRHEGRGELRRREGPTTISFFGTVVKPSLNQVGIQLTAMAALGSGRSGAMTRIVREEMRRSYRQHALLVPTSHGFLPVLTFATMPSDDDLELGGRVREALLSDIDSWNEANVVAARRYAISSFSGQAEWGPLFLTAHGSPGPGLADQTYLRAWWQMTFGQPYRASQVATMIEDVSVEKAKQRARQIVEQATIQVILGPRAQGSMSSHRLRHETPGLRDRE
ncbi:MAG: hypothetical protein ACK4XJ_00655 [Fimbriimonadaceae bacterium]